MTEVCAEVQPTLKTPENDVNDRPDNTQVKPAEKKENYPYEQVNFVIAAKQKIKPLEAEESTKEGLQKALLEQANNFKKSIAQQIEKNLPTCIHRPRQLLKVLYNAQVQHEELKITHVGVDYRVDCTKDDELIVYAVVLFTTNINSEHVRTNKCFWRVAHNTADTTTLRTLPLLLGLKNLADSVTVQCKLDSSAKYLAFVT